MFTGIDIVPGWGQSLGYLDPKKFDARFKKDTLNPEP